MYNRTLHVQQDTTCITGHYMYNRTLHVQPLQSHCFFLYSLKRRPTPRPSLGQMTADKLKEIFIVGHVLFTRQIFADIRINCAWQSSYRSNITTNRKFL